MDPAPRQLGEVGRGVVVTLLVLAVVLLTGAAVGPGSAEAFVGEGAVLNPAKTALTGPAQTILTNPTFLPAQVGSATAAGGVAEGSAALAAAEGAGLFPVMGALLGGFGVGAVIGSEICNSVLGLEGCWFVESEGADPAPKGSYHWVWSSTFKEGHGIKAAPYAWYSDSFTGFKPVDTSACKQEPPGGWTDILVGDSAACGKTEASPWMLAVRNQLSNRALGSHPSDTAMPNYAGAGYCAIGVACQAEPRADWAERYADLLNNPAKVGLTNGQRDALGQYVASQIPGSGVKNPYGTYVEIPDCDGLIYASCEELLEELGLSPIREKLDWTEVETPLPDEVVELDPAKSKEVEKGTGVKVITNPGEDDMPIVVPTPEEGETYGHYAARLNPGLTPERHDLDAAFIDPSVGPNGVVDTSPKPETRLDPDTTHKVDVTTNPADAPMVGAPWSPPGLSSIDMGPISGVPSPCSVFPFGLFCWIGEAFGQFNASGTCPHFSTPVAGTESNFAVTMCGDTADTILGYLRPAILLAFIVGCGVMFARGTKAVGGD